MKKLFLILAALITFTLGAVAQQRTVTGTVVNAEDGEPLAGATVMGQGTSIGTSTDLDGKFSLTLPHNVHKLVVSYVGMETREVGVGNGHLKIELSNTNTLDEVIAVAFGTAKKSAFTGSATVIKADDLAKHVTTNVANALVGSVPGLQMRGSSGAPGAGAGSINIRGISTMPTSGVSVEPLVIVDGSPYPASLSNIPQQDIESITVLKDAASAALYGARGASGVIIITTKKGKDETARITVEAKWGANTRATQRYDVIDNPGEFYEAYYEQMKNYAVSVGGYDPVRANSWANKNMLSQLSYQAYTVPEGQQLIGMNGRLNPNATLGYRLQNRYGDFWIKPDNWYDEAYHTALRQEYNVNVSGQTGKATYYTSLSYLDEDGIIDYSSFKRLTARFKGDFQAKKWLTLGVNVGYVYSEQKSNPNLSENANSTNMMYYTDMIAPIYPIYVRDYNGGKPCIATDQWGRQAYDYGTAQQGYGISRPFRATGNPFGSNRYNDVGDVGNQLNATATLDINFTPWLKGNVTSNVIWGSSNGTDYQNCFYGPKVAINGELSKDQTTSLRTNNIQTLTFFKTFGKHNVNVLAGHEYYRNTTRYIWAMAQGGFSPAIKEIAAFAKKADATSYKTTYNVEGYFARGQYDYDSKYFASVSYRRDASSRFDPSNRWGNFWSFGAAWLINKDFLTEVSWIDQLKLKFSVGQQGNDNIGNWAYVDIYSLNPTGTTMSPTFNRIGNKDITWEKTTNWNVGTEFSFFDSRLTGSVDFYYKKTTDLLFWLNLPESIGTRGYYTNIGDIRNLGVELVLNGEIIRSKLINWNVNFNLSHNSDKILTLPAQKKEFGGFESSENNIGMWYAEGKSLYNAALPVFAGVNEKGESLWFTDHNIDATNQRCPATLKDGVTTDFNNAPYYELGTTLPAVFGGFGTNFRIGPVDLTLTFDYSIGGKIFDQQYASYMSPTGSASSAGSTFHRDYKKAWSATNPNSNIPRWQYGDQYASSRSNRFLTSASYLNFQSFTVGYTLPKFCKDIAKIRVYCMGENLCFWSARQGLDPRYAYSGNSGISPYSPVRNISGGLQVTF